MSLKTSSIKICDKDVLNGNDEKFNEIVELLKKHDVFVQIDKHDKYGYLTILVDENKNVRGAGRKPIVIDNEEFANIRYLDIVELNKKMSHDEIARKLGLKIATYYRKLKKYRERYEQNNENCFFK